MVQKFGLNSLATRREIAHLKMLRSVYFYQNILLDLVIPKDARCGDVEFKTVLGRMQVYSNFFVPLTLQQWNTLPPHFVNIECLV